MLLKGKKGIIFGALNENSIAWKAALKCVQEGAEIILTNTEIAIRFGDVEELGKLCNAPVIAADATSVEDLENLVDKAMEHFGGQFDFVLHAVAMSQNLRKGRIYEDLSYEFYKKTLDVSAMSFHKLLQTLYKKDAVKEWGSVLALTYIAGDRAMFGYSDMADAKAMLQSIMRNFGLIYGTYKHVRVNTISQSPTPTTAGTGIDRMAEMQDYVGKISPLGNATAEECADYIAVMFSDYTRKVTMQNLYNDGGYSTMLPQMYI